MPTCRESQNTTSLSSACGCPGYLDATFYVAKIKSLVFFMKLISSFFVKLYFNEERFL